MRLEHIAELLTPEKFRAYLEDADTDFAGMTQVSADCPLCHYIRDSIVNVDDTIRITAEHVRADTLVVKLPPVLSAFVLEIDAYAGRVMMVCSQECLDVLDKVESCNS